MEWLPPKKGHDKYDIGHPFKAPCCKGVWFSGLHSIEVKICSCQVTGSPGGGQLLGLCKDGRVFFMPRVQPELSRETES